jgi:transcriptional regulator with XRE-family HTH domain
MPSVERLAALGTNRGTSLVHSFAREVRDARLAAGISQAAVAKSLGMSKSSVSRLETGRRPLPNLLIAARVARVVGLELSVRCFPAAGQLRDAAHVALMGRLVNRLHPAVECLFEAPVHFGDPRAWDILLKLSDGLVGVAAETRIRDLQALLRREHSKQADGGVDRFLLLVANTKHNRHALREAGPILAQALPMRTRALMASLRRGELPAADGVVIL